MTPAPLQLDGAGRLVSPDGAFAISYAEPWPTPNGTAGGMVVPAWGYVVHTEVGYEHSVQGEFTDPAGQASALVSIAGGFADIPAGAIHQYGPAWGFRFWTQAAGNPWYHGAEHEDGGDPTRPMPAEQLLASGAVAEVLSRHHGWPLQTCDHGGRGITTHAYYPSGQPDAAWGGHACPGSVRAAQVVDILRVAQQLRAPSPPPPPEDDMAGSFTVVVPPGAEAAVPIPPPHGGGVNGRGYGNVYVSFARDFSPDPARIAVGSPGGWRWAPGAGADGYAPVPVGRKLVMVGAVGDEIVSVVNDHSPYPLAVLVEYEYVPPNPG